MKKFFVRNAVNVVGLPLSTWAFLFGFVPWALAASTLTIEQSAHFLESDGSDVVVEAGTYDVDTLVGSQLKLDTASGNTGVRFRWVPTIPANGQNDVYIRWPNHSNRSTTVPYTVHHVGENTVKNFNQQTGGADAVKFVRVP